MALTAFKLGKGQEIMTKKKERKEKNSAEKSSTIKHKLHVGPGWFLLVRAGLVLASQGTKKKKTVTSIP